MVIGQMGRSIYQALQLMSNAIIIDEKVLSDCLNEISRALLQSDVPSNTVQYMQSNISKIVNLNYLAAGHINPKIVQKAVFDELCMMLNPGKLSFTLKKGKRNVIMFVGLPASGKTTACTKYAYYYEKKGFKPALVCADTFKRGAFDQLRINAIKAKIPYHGSYVETDPVKVAIEGVKKFSGKDGRYKGEKRDLIIIDTSGRHKDEDSLFEEVRRLSNAIKPDLVIFVMDGSIGQKASNQVQAFKKKVPNGAVIVTKMDGNAKGGGALSVVAATKSPIIFIGTGEHVHDLEMFNVWQFVIKFLGLGDWWGFVDRISELVPTNQHREFVQKFYRNFQIYSKESPSVRLGGASTLIDARRFVASYDSYLLCQGPSILSI